MKRPGRPVKRKAVKRAVAKPRKRAPRNPSPILDPFHIAQDKVPVGWDYQWMSGGCSPNSGWRPVPFSRHAHDFPDSARDDSGFIAIDGLMLCEIQAEHVKRELEALKDKAKALARSIEGLHQEGKGFYIMPADWVEQREIIPEAQQNEGPPVDVAVTLMMRVPVRWQSAATYLNLDLSEYTRRRLLMDRSILGLLDPFAVDPIYETVNLHFSPTDSRNY